MNPDPSKLRQQHREEQQTAALNQTQQQGREFATVEELIKFDSGQVTVPPEIAERLHESIAQEPKPLQPWWRRWFSGKN